MKILLWSICIAAFVVQQSSAHDVIVVLDDVSRDKLSVYGNSDGGADTPELDTLAAAGVAFSNAVGAANCSPARHMIMTALDPHISGFVTNPNVNLVPPWPEFDPATALVPLQLEEAGVRTAITGKLHLTIDYPGAGKSYASLPAAMGFTRAAHTLEASPAAGRPTLSPDPGGTYTHSRWVSCNLAGQCELIEDPAADDSKTADYYTTSLNVDDAIAWLAEATTDSVDAVIFVLLTAPHAPWWPPPPAGLAPINFAACEAAGDGGDDGLCYLAHLEAADTEIGRLADAMSLDPSTGSDRLWVIADNGTPGNITGTDIHGDCASDKSKGTIYSCGIGVPFFVTGRGVTDARVTSQPIQLTDIAATLFGLHGVSRSSHNSRSFEDCFSGGADLCSTRAIARSVQGTRNDTDHIPPDDWYDDYDYEYRVTAIAVGNDSSLYSLWRNYVPFDGVFDRDGSDCDGAQTACESELYDLTVNYYNSEVAPGVDYWDNTTTLPAGTVQQIYNSLSDAIYDIQSNFELQRTVGATTVGAESR